MGHPGGDGCGCVEGVVIRLSEFVDVKQCSTQCIAAIELFLLITLQNISNWILYPMRVPYLILIILYFQIL